ncbi:hypothetical protein NQ314_016395 [Rhamnusium bicolor]|uniref:Polycystin domain-containing protein n=1 Tax=Rhamnusium bicolor TaxID=1586634 RepID=A0AAV8WYQ4_9CUCU|nr:hypothetical protein NQ314_016395 [Rhamnusium bicolor]
MKYLNSTLIFSMQSLQWYGTYISRNPGMTIDNANKYVGVARLRQHRIRGNSCSIPIIMRTEECNPEYSSSPEYEDFSEAWMNDTFSDKFARLDHIWDYTKALQAGTLAYEGNLCFLRYNPIK